MEKTKVFDLMDRLGLKHTTKTTATQAGESIKKFLGERDLPEDIELDEVEETYLESLGFAFEPDGNDDEADHEADQVMLECATCGKEVPEDEAHVDEETGETYCSKKCWKAAAKAKSTNAPPKKARASKVDKPKSPRDKIAKVTGCIEAFLGKKGSATRKDIFEHVSKKLPEANPNTIRTQLSRGQNPKWTQFAGGKLLVKGEDKKLSLKG